MKIVVGTRGSNLAVTQTNWVVSKLKEKNPNVDFEVKIIKTKGDIVQDVLLHKMNDKGIFVKEIEDALLRGDIDFAVHSMKDMPTELPKGLKIANPPKREDPRDALVLRGGILNEAARDGKAAGSGDTMESLENLENLENLTIGTGSKRRMYQLESASINTKPIRGNIETRIGKIEKENIDGVMLAASGMIRAGYEDQISILLDEETFVPAPCQGVLAIEVREDDVETEKVVNSISHHDTIISTAFEREFLSQTGAGCHSPVGAFCKVLGEDLKAVVLWGNEGGSIMIKKTAEFKVGEEKEAAKKLADEIRKEFKAYE